jgi:exodeoxyribonuclease V gamma subunit
MLKFYHGTNLENLADQVIKELDDSPPENLLSPEFFVVQNHGIGQWLSLYMAENTKERIAANLEFEFPSERIWKLIRLINPDIPQNLPSDRQPMTWSLMELFSDEQVLDEFDNIRHYISVGNPDQHEMRRWKLASKIADVFDQYLIYRPQMILDWEGSNTSFDNKVESWQAKLWNRLLNHWQEVHKEERLHRAQLQHQLWENIDNRNLNTQDLPDRISVFGVSTASPAFIKTLVKLSKLTNVHFYQLSVDPQIKDSNDYRNPLLKSLGDEGTNFMAQFASFVEEDKEVVGSMEWKPVDDTDTPVDMVFRAVQADVRQDNKISGRNLNVPQADSTIQVHSCHSPMREVEVLYDQLLAILDENQEINPDEILIMTPDIEIYAPMIEAVFETPDEGQPAIPYSIADRGAGTANIPTESFIKILDLCESRFKVTDVLDLLDAAPVQEAFEFTDDELNILERWIRDNRIRWGIDGNNKQQMNLPESDHFTWQAGLRRILLGYMMRPDADKLYLETFAYDEIETSDDAELAGKLSHFLNKLFEISKQADQPKSPRQWQEQLNKVVDRFLPENRDYFWEVSRIREVLNNVKKYASLAGYNRKVPFSILRRWLQEQLQEDSSGGGRIGRGVTFSSLKPMRSIPFQVIGMIGMNEGAFPSSKIPIEFDLMHLDPRRGDPKKSEEDRYLFLENILSARTHLYFSYVGQSNRQDAEFPPTVVIQEFLDYLEEHYGFDPDKIVQKHRLQAFSPNYFTDKDYFSYSQSQMDISRRLSESTTAEFFTTQLPEPGEEWKHLTVGDLISFFQHPIKFLLRNRLGIYLREEDVLTEDREPFSLDKLDEYKVGQELLERFLNEQSLETYEKVIRSRDLLPEGWSGEQTYRQKATEVTTFGNEIKYRLDQQQLANLEVNLEINGYRVVGTLSNIYKDAQITYRFGKARPKDKIDWWIRHLLFQQVKPQGHSGSSLLFSWDNSSLEEYRLSPVNNAEEVLAELLDWYWKGLRKPLSLYCKSSYAFAESVIKDGENEEKGIDKAIKKWEAVNTPNYYIPGEGDDAYNRLVTEGKRPFKGSGFRKISNNFWAPFFEVLNQEEA